MTNIEDNIDRKEYAVTYVVYLDKEDNKRFFYIAIKREKIPAFQEAAISGDFNPSDYGVILEEGDGEACEEIRLKMKVKFNCDHERASSLDSD